MVAPQKGLGGAVHVPAAADDPEPGAVAVGQLLEEGVAVVLRDDARGRDRDVAGLRPVYRLEVRIPGGERAEETPPVGHHPPCRPDLLQDGLRRLPLEEVQPAGLHIAVDLRRVEHLHHHDLGEAPDMPRERLPAGARGVSGAEALRIPHPEPGERPGLPGIEKHARHHQGPERGAPARLIDSEDPPGPGGTGARTGRGSRHRRGCGGSTAAGTE